ARSWSARGRSSRRRRSAHPNPMEDAMLRQSRRVAVGAVLALVVFASSASAECAWVLWAHEVLSHPLSLDVIEDKWEPLSAAPDKLTCERSGLDEDRESTPKLKRFAKESGLKVNILHRCLPDTVDPRGPRTR